LVTGVTPSAMACAAINLSSASRLRARLDAAPMPEQVTPYSSSANVMAEIATSPKKH